MNFAIVTTHPIQYYAPLFQLLAKRETINLKVFYTWNPATTNTHDPGFGKKVEWDIPLLEGYPYTFVANTSHKPGSSHFRGIINPTLIKEISAWGANAILVFGWSYHSHLQVLRYFKGKIPVYFRGDSHLLNERPNLKTIARRIFLRWVYSYIDYALYVGENNKQYFLVHGLQERQLLFAPHAIDNKRFISHAEEYTKQAYKWRERLGVQPSETIFLYAGKLEPTKNPFLLLQAFIALSKPNTHLIFVGNGALGDKLKQAAHPYKNIHFIDFQNQSQMPIVYRLGNIFVLPSKGETWGLAVNEAMACGLPILVSDKVGCAIDLVKPGCNGYIFQSGKQADLIEKMQLILQSKNNLEKMSKHSEEIIKNWSIQEQVRRIEDAFIS